MVPEEEINTRCYIHSKPCYKKFIPVLLKRTNETESRRSSLCCPGTSSTVYEKECKFVENCKVQLKGNSNYCQAQTTSKVTAEEKASLLFFEVKNLDHIGK